MSLTAKQQRFVQEFLIDLNATQAAIRAGYSTRTANEQGARLLAKVSVRSAVEDGQKAREKRTGITQDRVLNEIARVAFSDKRRLMSWGPSGVVLMDSETLTDDDAANVSEVSETTSATGGSIKLKTHDKIKALELLGRHLGMFTDKVEHGGQGGGPLQVIVKRYTEDG